VYLIDSNRQVLLLKPEGMRPWMLILAVLFLPFYAGEEPHWAASIGQHGGAWQF
jgi:hypothetical protein